MVKARICALILVLATISSCATVNEEDTSITAGSNNVDQIRLEVILPLPAEAPDLLYSDNLPEIDYRSLQKKIYPLIIDDLQPLIRAVEVPVIEPAVSQESINPLIDPSLADNSPPNRDNDPVEEHHNNVEHYSEPDNNPLNFVEPDGNVLDNPQDSNENSVLLLGLLNQEIVLPGRNWIFIREKENKDVRLLGKDYRSGDTVFRFDFPFWGAFALEFDQQDNLTGTQNSRQIAVNVAEENAQEESLAELDSQPENLPPLSADPQTVIQWGLDKNEWDFLKDYLEDQADRNSGSDNFWDLFSLIPDQDRTYSLRMDILELLAEKEYFGEIELQTSLLFHLAQMLEKPGPKRDLAKAYELYETIVNLNPFSHYADKSELRMDYLERHYFIVR